MRIANIESCCGCGNCEQVCKHDAIRIHVDPVGFYKREIDESKCINCRACERVCPITGDIHEYTTTLGLKAFYAKASNSSILRNTSSGGIATVLSSYWLEGTNSVVYGSQYTENCKEVQTIRVNNIRQLKKLCGSKYVQSLKEDIFQSVKKDLDNEINVLFIGLPCDIVALKLYLHKKYDSLLTCELVCHGTTSLFALREYIEHAQRKRTGKVLSINMRYKKKGKWVPYYFDIQFSNGKHYIRNFWESEFGFAFSKFRNSSCYSCPFKGDNRCADLTIGDAWGAPKKILDENKGGLSAVLLNSPKGVKMFEQFLETDKVEFIKTDKECLINGNPNLNRCDTMPKEYYSIKEEFYKNGLYKTVRKFRSLRSRMIIAIKAMAEKM